jgi:hypothetical protein
MTTQKSKVEARFHLYSLLENKNIFAFLSVILPFDV